MSATLKVCVTGATPWGSSSTSAWRKPSTVWTSSSTTRRTPSVRENVTAAVERGCAVVMGASGLTTDDFQDIDYAAATTPDSSSGTARELAERLAEVHPPQVEMLIDDVAGAPEPRGTNVRSTQVHSVRLPSFVVSTEMLFALPDERLSIRHDAGSPPQPYVTGTLLAVRAVTDLVGVVRGLDSLLLQGTGDLQRSGVQPSGRRVAGPGCSGGWTHSTAHPEEVGRLTLARPRRRRSVAAAHCLMMERS